MIRSQTETPEQTQCSQCSHTRRAQAHPRTAHGAPAGAGGPGPGPRRAAGAAGARGLNCMVKA